MSSGDQSILVGDQQLDGSNADEDNEVVSKYFVNVEKVKSNEDKVDPAAGKVNSDVGSVDPAAEIVNSDMDIVDPAAEPVNSDVDIVDPAAEKVNSDVDIVDPAAEPVNSDVDIVDPAAEPVNSDVDIVDPAAEPVNSDVDIVDPAAEPVNSDVDIVDPAAEPVNSDVDIVDPAAEPVNSDVDIVDLAAEKVNSDVEIVDPAAEKVNSNAEIVDPASEKVNLNAASVDFTAEKVDTDAESMDLTAEKVNLNADSVDLTAVKTDTVVHVDHMENICDEECLKKMGTELNDRLPETLENLELEKMIVQTDSSSEDLQTPQAVDLQARPSCDTEQTLDIEEATQIIEDADTLKEQIQYTEDDFRSPERGSDMERDTDEEIDVNAITCVKVSESSVYNDVKIGTDKDMGASRDCLPSENEDDDAGKTKSTHWTWKQVDNKKGERKEHRKKGEKRKLVKRFSDRDTENYRNGYPGKEDDEYLNDNVKFYMGEIASSPDGALIDDIHKNWRGNYKLLERHHGYIQWLFPIRENGMNWQAQPLQLHEAEAIKADRKARQRVLESYKLMLDFYGMQLVDETTGKLERSTNWKPRFDNLNWSSHNFLRITRILKCLGELGYEHLKKSFIQFVLEEALEHHTLEQTVSSCQDYWIGTIKNDQDREELYDYIDRFESKNFR